MAITRDLFQLPVEPTNTVFDTTSTGDLMTYRVLAPIEVHSLLVNITETVGTPATNAVFSVDVTTRGGSRTEMGTLTIPDSQAVDTVVELDLKSLVGTLDVGDELILVWKTQSSATTPGQGKAALLCKYVPRAHPITFTTVTS